MWAVAEIMLRVAERFRIAVQRISATQDQDLLSLPRLERSLTPVLSVASAFYAFGILVRRLLYHFHILHRTRLSIPVVSVGNVTWGGTGKTPMVEYLTRHFLAARVCPLILTRGYRGGDEVRLLQKHLEDTPTRIGVGPNRAKMALSMLNQQVGGSHNGIVTVASHKLKSALWDGYEEIGIAILDDGMQHWALERDVEIVLINVVSLWGNGRLIPRGPLRESIKALERAHVVVLHHAQLVQDEKLKEITRTLHQYLKSGSIVICSHMRPLCFYTVSKSSEGESSTLLRVPLEKVKDAVILCVSAIGCPESVARVLMQEGAAHVERLDFSDHHKFATEDRKLIPELFEQLQLQHPFQKVLLVTTEKDYLRDPAVIAELGSIGDGVFVLHSSLEIISSDGNYQAFTELLDSVCFQSVRRGTIV